MAAAFVMAFLVSGIGAPLAHAQTFTTLHSFANSDGASPYYGSLIMDAAGNLYGTTKVGGTGLGVAFELVASNNYQETVLHTFSYGTGAYPYGSLVMDSQGNLYGTTETGGTGYGVVFELQKTAPGAYTYSALYTFLGTGDGQNPYAGLTIDSSGNLYGTTYQGGAYTYGEVFELEYSENYSTLHVLYSFTGDEGIYPYASVIIDSSLNLYGTTHDGGADGFGEVFELEHSESYSTEHVLYSFSDGADGGNPYAGLVMDSNSNLYGTTESGGSGYGVVFEIPYTSGSYSTEQVLHTFTGGSDGSQPFGGVIRDSSGNLYGTTYGGGLGDGVVFELLDSSGSYSESVLHTFTDTGTDGANPYAGLVMSASGSMFGTTETGGSNFSYGTVFELSTVFQFASFTATLDGVSGSRSAFHLQANFTLGAGSPGINPLTDPLTLQVGSYSVTIPGGSFQGSPSGSFTYNGVVSGTSLNIRISPNGANAYSIQVKASGGNLNVLASPVPIGLTIGDNTGSTTYGAANPKKSPEEN